MKTRVAILISGRGTNMAALLYASRAPAAPFEITLVTGDNPDAPGLALAEAEGIPVARLPAPTKATKAAFYDALDAALTAASADLVVCAGFMRILPADFVARWAGRILNIHPSLLPKYRGLDTHRAALDAGDTTAGCTVHLVTAELDAGPILAQTQVAILPGDTVDTLGDRVRIAEHQLLPRALAEFIAKDRDPAALTGRVAALALALPETRLKTSHGAPGWKVGSPSSDKFFAIMWLNHHDQGGTAVLVKTSGQDEMADLIDREPDLYFRPQYYGPSDWIGLTLDRPGTDWAHVADWLNRSWTIVAPARLTKLLRAADDF